MSNFSHHQQNDQNEHDQTYTAAVSVTPAAIVSLGRQRADQHQDDYDQNYPRNLSWTGVPARDTVPSGDISVRFCGFLARRDDDADCTLLGEATPPGSRKYVQSRP